MKYIYSAAYIVSIILANMMVLRWGIISLPGGLLAPAGTFAAGFALVFRDIIQLYTGKLFVLSIIILGSILSMALVPPQIAVASGGAFLASELLDWSVFTPLRKRSLAMAIIVSSSVSAPFDTIFFLSLAHYPITLNIVIGQTLIKIGIAALVAGGIILHKKVIRNVRTD